ncbi:hypothetical protein LCGC14_2373440 [marine sediment metagenome]|uniref:FCP1 homology domain-containing protein n=1 Tax=marine sediment metagenome TaxID=412755 RepID=A0A0F9C341_9ZZZZ
MRKTKRAPLAIRQRVGVIDLDGTLAEYDGWQGPTHFGKPVLNALDAVKELNTWGWRLIVHTTRGDERMVETWLEANGFLRYLDTVNSTVHNPEGCSHKPIAEVYFEDREANIVNYVYLGKSYNWRRAMRRVRRMYQPPLNVEIDDAAAWAGWPARFVRRWAWFWFGPWVPWVVRRQD